MKMNDFIELFNDYTNNKTEKYGRINYNKWRELRAWKTRAPSDHVYITKMYEDGYHLRCGDEFVEFSSYISDEVPFVEYLNDHLQFFTTGKEEKKEMSKFNFDFGPLKNDNLIRLSPYGLAIKNENGSYVSWDAKSQTLIDVDVLNFKGSKFFFKLPIALNDVKVGDVIYHQNVPHFVSKVSGDHTCIAAINPLRATKEMIIPVRSIYGFNYVTKVVSLLGDFKFNASEAAPFGNMLPFFLMNDGEDKDFDPMVFLLMNGECDFAQNPMMLYFLMSGKEKNDSLLPFLLMNNMTKKAQE